jgi:hypothetical protein
MPKEVWPEYVAILEGEPLSKLYDTELSEEDLENQENEMLSKGQAVPALATDDHPCHIRSHAGLLNDPMIRMNGEKNGIILEHIMEHYELAKNTDPILTAMVRTGKMPEGAMMQPGAGPGGPPEGPGMAPPPSAPPPPPRALGPAAVGGPPPPPPQARREKLPGDVAALPTPKTAPMAPDLLGRRMP